MTVYEILTSPPTYGWREEERKKVRVFELPDKTVIVTVLLRLPRGGEEQMFVFENFRAASRCSHLIINCNYEWRVGDEGEFKRRVYENQLLDIIEERE